MQTLLHFLFFVELCGVVGACLHPMKLHTPTWWVQATQVYRRSMAKNNKSLCEAMGKKVKTCPKKPPDMEQVVSGFSGPFHVVPGELFDYIICCLFFQLLSGIKKAPTKLKLFRISKWFLTTVKKHDPKNLPKNLPTSS